MTRLYHSAGVLMALVFIALLVLLPISSPTALVNAKAADDKKAPAVQENKKKAKKIPKPSVKKNKKTTIQSSEPTLLQLSSIKFHLQSTDGTRELSKSLTYPDPLPDVVDVFPGDSLRFGFQLNTVPRDGKGDGKGTRAHQAFLRFQPTDSKAPNGVLVQVLQSTLNGKHRIELITNRFLKYFQQHQGNYNVEVILGQFGDVQPVRYLVGTLNFKFPVVDLEDPQAAAAAAEEQAKRSAQRALEGPPDEEFRVRPIIVHHFRQPDSVPPKLFSVGFSAVILSPWLVLLGLWKALGVNFNNLPTTSVDVVAHASFLGGLVSFIGLYYLYWTSLRLVETVLYGAVLGIVTVLVGRVALSDVAHRRVKSTKKE